MNSKVFQVSLIKTIWFNIHYFGIKGLKLPVLISKKTVLKTVGGEVIISNPTFGCIHIGFDAIGIFDYYKDRSIWENSGTIAFHNKATLGHGVRISNVGTIIFGNNFRLTANSSFICHKEIKFGENCLISWNCRFMDTDFHKIYDVNNIQTNNDKEITVGNNVWIGSECKILKGSHLADGCVVACGSVLSRINATEKNCIIGSFGKVLKKDVKWLP